jgi:uncharacterized membrane protein YhiD involved in acid resistance
MAVGGGYYLTAVFATVLVLFVLFLLGFIERFINLKVMIHCYEVTGQNPDELMRQVNGLLEPLHALMQNLQVAPTPRHVRVRFECTGTRRTQAKVLDALRHSAAFESVAALGPVQPE